MEWPGFITKIHTLISAQIYRDSKALCKKKEFYTWNTKIYSGKSENYDRIIELIGAFKRPCKWS